VERVPEEESTAYFNSRPRSSRIGAWVSLQSQVVPGGRADIEARWVAGGMAVAAAFLGSGYQPSRRSRDACA
jgi:pyridoxine/pyridoxamine 5'-phosphate oxidase